MKIVIIRNNESKMFACLISDCNSQRVEAKGFQTCLLSYSKLLILSRYLLLNQILLGVKILVLEKRKIIRI
ncbi:MAG: hypothetical protein OEM28_01505 [Nitrosopumilus sp.]|nr:hypothetical protein [Nitrosopumilus sp.]